MDFFVCRDHWLRLALCPRHHSTGPPKSCLDQRHTSSDRGMDRAPGVTEAFLWAEAPAYLVRDNDRAYGHVFTSRLRAMGIRDRPIAPASPWQNGHAERLIGTVRRECLDRR